MKFLNTNDILQCNKMQSESIHIIPYARRFGGKARDCSDTLYTCAHVARVCGMCMCAMQNIPASFHPVHNENGTLARTGREELKATRRRVRQSPPGNPASGRKKKITGAKMTTAMTPSAGSARSLKIFLFFSFHNLFRVSFNRRKCEAYKNGVPRHTRRTRVLPFRVPHPPRFSSAPPHSASNSPRTILLAFALLSRTKNEWHG